MMRSKFSDNIITLILNKIRWIVINVFSYTNKILIRVSIESIVSTNIVQNSY